MRQPQPDITLPTKQKVKTYVAKISQTGTNDPQVTILANDIGNIVWARIDAGDYSGTLNGAFPTDKTIIGEFADTSPIVLPFFTYANPGDFWYQFTFDINSILLNVFDATGTKTELSYASAGFPIIIRITVFN